MAFDYLSIQNDAPETLLIIIIQKLGLQSVEEGPELVSRSQWQQQQQRDAGALMWVEWEVKMLHLYFSLIYSRVL